ncbi:hypothetical protein LCI18_013690 [Fusarium solani-melongenae]|uniref:Uncharacterized protein n=1 Tax=Fusarium solani subsp. cucurbitae TaxID=2747967 RepID=A0ACD3ZNF1_FUSSC|nr:hypothetical protein LCI18_013690 [Fusarium solani-melongenae]
MSSVAESKIDVLVIGAGPSGLMLMTWLARLGIKARIVDKRFDRINSGQADGLQSRTFEIFDSLGFGQDVWREANHMLEIRFWDRLLEYIDKFSDIEVEYGVMPESLTIDVDKVESDEYPISVTLRSLPRPDANSPHVPTDEGEPEIPNGLHRSNLTADSTDEVLQNAQTTKGTRTEKVLAKYVVGCDGAHSWTRRQIGSVMEGDQTDYIWSAPLHTSADIRYRCAIHSDSGSMMVIPRENKYVRLYIQVTEVDENGKAIDRFKITPRTLIQAANKILSPYKLSYKHCHWWTAYRIGQRVGSKFNAHDRVFLAGDAVHTHSPKAGQGMNISMHDSKFKYVLHYNTALTSVPQAFNLGWKLASVVKGWARRSLLTTYTTERRQIAKELIEFDQRFSRLFSGRPAKDVLDEGGIDLKTFKQVFDKGNLFASGCAVDYGASVIVAKHQVIQNANGTGAVATVGKQELAPNIPIGMRIPSYKVLNQSDARPWHLQELMPSTGAWRVVVFAGDVLDPAQFSRLSALGKALSSPSSFLNRHKPEEGQRLASFFEILTVHSSPRHDVELLSLPDIFHPYSEEYGWDYEKVFVDDVSYHEGHGQAYATYGIDTTRGCVVIVRPDQYVSWIGELEDVDDINRFFEGIFKSRV